VSCHVNISCHARRCLGAVGTVSAHQKDLLTMISVDARAALSGVLEDCIAVELPLLQVVSQVDDGLGERS